MKAATRQHERHMQEALALARQGEGLTRPNPPVGAVITKGSRVIGRGYHRRAGGPHAEIAALEQAGVGARGATLYVTLEPCSTRGRTPPCTEAILGSGIRHVVVSVTDPNPRHAGRGLSRLKRQGVQVTKGLCAREGALLIRPFKKWICTGLPYLTLKLAMSADGKIGDRRGRSQWITGRESRAAVHALRRIVDGILVGKGTLLADDPSLLPRPRYNREVFRIVTDTRGTIPLTARVLNDRFARRTIIAVTRGTSDARQERIRAKGAEVLVACSKSKRVSLSDLMKQLGKKGMLHVLCEGGGELAAGLLREGLVDELLLFMAPMVIGGANAVNAVSGPGWNLSECPQLEFEEFCTMGRDLLIRAYPHKK